MHEIVPSRNRLWKASKRVLPDGLHVPGVEGFVVILEVDPTTKSTNDLLPVVSISHDDLATFLVNSK